MISVLLPAYNAEDYIQRAIDSILAQTYVDFELLVINDGSTDNTARLVASYADSRVQLINMPENVGLIEALNHGLQIASRKYIARMDADDISLPTRLAKQLRFLEDNQDYVACGTGIINFNEKSESYLQYPQTDADIRVALHFFERNICHPTVMLRRETLVKHGIRYRCDYKHAEDYVLWRDLSRVGKLYNLKEGLLRYFRHENQISQKYYPAQIAISKTIVTESIKEVWPEITDEQLDSILKLCIHEQGVFPDQHFTLKEIDNCIKWIMRRNIYSQSFDIKSLEKILYFKKFRCTFYYFYPFNFITKLLCFVEYLLVEPTKALSEIKKLIWLFVLLKIKS